MGGDQQSRTAPNDRDRFEPVPLTGESVEPVRTIEEGADGSLWLGTDNGRLYRGMHGRFLRIETGDHIRNAIRVLKSDRDDNLWIGTIGTRR